MPGTQVRPSPTFSVNPLRLIAALVDARRLDTEKLLAAHGLSRAMLDDLEARVPFEQACRLIDAVAALIGDADFGLTIGTAGPMGTGVPLYAVRASATVGEAYRTLSRLHRLVTDVGHVTVEEEQGTVRLQLHPDADGLGFSRHLAEMYVALWLRGARELSGVDIVPRAARFRHAAPPDLSGHRRFFRAPLTFDWVCDELELDAAVLELPLRTAEPTLARILDRYAQEILARLPPADDFSVAVRQIVATSLGDHASTLERLAERFHLSPRTLQRRLSKKGLSLRALVDDARRQLALQFVARPELTVSEIAYRLGFDAVTSFHRAFRRWTGQTPAQYRQRIQENEASR